MTVSILIITHENVGSALLNVALKTFGKLPLPIVSVPIKHDSDPDTTLNSIRSIISSLNNTDGVLILTDLFGATPSNIARALQNEVRVKVVTGINLPMLIRVLNYPDLCLHKLAEKAITGGKDGVLNCEEYA